MAIKYWYVLAFALLVSLLIAFAVNRYTTQIFPVSASIIIKESQENVEGKLLYNNVLVNPYRNFYNEPHIIKSTPLITGVINELDFTTTLFREGEIKTSEVYDSNLPIDIHLIKRNPKYSNTSFDLSIISLSQFNIEISEQEISNNLLEQIDYGDTVKLNGFTFLVTRNNNPIDQYLNNVYTVNFSTPERLAKAYAKRLTVSWQEQGSSVINLDMKGTLPSKDVAFLNELITQYQDYDLNKKNQAAIRTIEFIYDHLNFIADSVRFFETQVETFKKKYVLTKLDGEALRLYQRIESLETNLAQLNLQGNYYKYLTDYLRNDDNLDQVVPPSSVGVDDPIMTNLISQLVNLQMEVKVQLSNEKIESPFLVRKQEQIVNIRKDILESVRSTLEAQQINKKFIQGQIKLVEQQLVKLPESERRLVNIQRNYSLSENLYIFLMQKRAEAGISKAATTSDILVVNPPRLVGASITPKPVQNYAIAVVMGLFVPLLFFVTIEFLDNRIQSKEDIERLVDVPIIGGIGHNKIENNLVVHKKSKSSVAESFRSLRSNLNFFTNSQEKSVFLVTSSISGEGKTFTTINLATVLGMSGKRVLIIGADMRRPRLFDDFGLDNAKGLSNVLSGQLKLEAAIQSTTLEGIDLISGGPVPPNPSELLMSNQMDNIISLLLKKYDYIVLDTPPIGLVTDAFILSKFSDHMLFLVRQSYTPKQAVKTLQEFYQNGKIQNVSILFNDIKKVGPGYGYGYGYNYGYGYGYRYGYPQSSKNGYYTD